MLCSFWYIQAFLWVRAFWFKLIMMCLTLPLSLILRNRLFEVLFQFKFDFLLWAEKRARNKSNFLILRCPTAYRESRAVQICFLHYIAALVGLRNELYICICAIYLCDAWLFALFFSTFLLRNFFWKERRHGTPSLWFFSLTLAVFWASSFLHEKLYSLQIIRRPFKVKISNHDSTVVLTCTISKFRPWSNSHSTWNRFDNVDIIRVWWKLKNHSNVIEFLIVILDLYFAFFTLQKKHVKCVSCFKKLILSNF